MIILWKSDNDNAMTCSISVQRVYLLLNFLVYFKRGIRCCFLWRLFLHAHIVMFLKNENISLLNKQVLFFYRENKFKLIKTVGSFTPIYFKYHVNERNQEAASLLWALIFQIFCSLSICYDISTFLFNVYITTKRKQQVSLKLNYFIACFSFFYEVWYYKVLQFLCRCNLRFVRKRIMYKREV